MTEAGPGKAKRFSFEQARALLPRVRQLTEQAHRKVETLTDALPPPGPERDRAEEKLNQIVTEWARAVAEHGIEVKGLWLVDFDNGSGYYCWRYPEDALEYYHSYEDGFQGRLRIQ